MMPVPPAAFVSVAMPVAMARVTAVAVVGYAAVWEGREVSLEMSLSLGWGCGVWMKGLGELWEADFGVRIMRRCRLTVFSVFTRRASWTFSCWRAGGMRGGPCHVREYCGCIHDSGRDMSVSFDCLYVPSC